MQAIRSTVILASLAVCILSCYIIGQTDQPPDSSQLAERFGYTLQSHKVQTEDGYILTIHRMAKMDIEQGGDDTRPVVFLQHGLTCNSAAFLTLKSSLGYFLFDEGYDVWIGNARGNNYSKKHVNFSSSDTEFWDFSWHEMGVYDLPATIDYILNETRKDNIHYVGHSMAASMMLALLSSKPEYNAKVSHWYMMAPVVYMKGMRGKILTWTFVYYSQWLIKSGHQSWNPFIDTASQLLYHYCQPEKLVSFICLASYSLFGATTQMNPSTLPVFYGSSVTSTSIKAFAHYAQIYTNNEFRPWIEGDVKPPAYQTELITSPVTVIYADNDLNTSEKDVFKLFKSLRNVTFFKVPNKKFGHMDFLFGKDAKYLVNELILKELKIHTT